MQDDSGSGQDQQLGGAKTRCVQLHAPAQQADGGLVKHQAHRRQHHPGDEQRCLGQRAADVPEAHADVREPR